MKFNYVYLTFNEAIDFFKIKVNLPTESWTDLWEGMHSRAFVIAGATKDELLTDFRTALDKAIKDGIPLPVFQKDFDNIVKKHGWPYKGGRGWRSSLIYSVNLRVAHQAGRYKQMKAVTKTRPYWQYKHADYVAHPRIEHQSWDGLILRYDDPWWNTHYTPNGWGCKCRINTLSERDLLKLGKAGPDTAPPMEWMERTVGKNGPNPRTVKVPKGIDPGWGYNVGEAAWGKPAAVNAIEKYNQTKGWKNITPGNWETYGLPEKLIPDVVEHKPEAKLTNAPAMIQAVKQALDAEQRVFEIKTPGFTYPVYVNAEVLGDHINPDRSPFIPLLVDALENPHEIWQTFLRSEKTGKIVLRTQIIRVVKTQKNKSIILVTDAQKGRLVGWTFIPSSKSIKSIRVGKLVYARNEEELSRRP